MGTEGRGSLWRLGKVREMDQDAQRLAGFSSLLLKQAREGPEVALWRDEIGRLRHNWEEVKTTSGKTGD